MRRKTLLTQLIVIYAKHNIPLFTLPFPLYQTISLKQEQFTTVNSSTLSTVLALFEYFIYRMSERYLLTQGLRTNIRLCVSDCTVRVTTVVTVTDAWIYYNDI